MLWFTYINRDEIGLCVNRYYFSLISASMFPAAGVAFAANLATRAGVLIACGISC